MQLVKKYRDSVNESAASQINRFLRKNSIVRLESISPVMPDSGGCIVFAIFDVPNGFKENE